MAFSSTNFILTPQTVTKSTPGWKMHGEFEVFGKSVLETVGLPDPEPTTQALTTKPDCQCRWCIRVAPSDRERMRQMRTSSARKKFLTQDVEKIRTQKARGIYMLKTMGGFADADVPLTMLLQSGRDAKTILSYLHAREQHTAFMGRPCPMTPRHGFVPSRPVSTVAALQQVWKETRRADPEGEVLVQPWINAAWSAVLTPTRVSYGPGNDGATAGKGALQLRLGRDPHDADRGNVSGHHPHLAECAGILAPDVPYLEFVYDSHWRLNVVQVRAGTAFPATADYIPRDVRVARVRTLHGTEDEMAWEAEAKRLAAEPGVVVYHPGGSMISHFGVHCGINEVPYITTHEPAVGTMERQACEEEPLAIESLRDGLLCGLASRPQVPLYSYSELDGDETVESFPRTAGWSASLKMAMFLLHNYNADHGEQAAWFLGAGAGWLWRALAAACLGEYRHYTNSVPFLRAWGPPERRHIYHWMLALPPEQIIAPLQIATEEFLRGTHWHNSYGGLLWGRCGLTALRLYVTMSEFAQSPTHAHAQAFIASLNTTVHVAHNGGWVFNKFIDPSVLNAVAQLCRPLLMHSVVPAMIGAASIRTWNLTPVGARALGVPWTLDPELVRYADDTEDSIKRCEHPSGSRRVLEEQRQVEQFCQWLEAYFTWYRQRLSWYILQGKEGNDEQTTPF